MAVGGKHAGNVDDLGQRRAIAGGQHDGVNSPALESAKAAPCSVKWSTAGLTAMRPALMAAIVPTSISGMRRRSLIADSGPSSGRPNPKRARLPNTRREISRPRLSPSAIGARRMRMLVTCVGRPRNSRGTTLTGVRTASVGLAPRSASSSAISAPVLPAPTTSTFLPRTARRCDSRRVQQLP